MPAGKAMFHMCGVFAEFERSIIQERINAGLVRAKVNGKWLGRQRVDTEVEKAIPLALDWGDKGIRKIAREIGVRVSVVQRILGSRLPDSTGANPVGQLAGRACGGER